MVFQVMERLVQWRMVVLAISNPLHEGLPVVSLVEPLSTDSLARLWSGFSPVTGGVLSDLVQGCILSPSTLRLGSGQALLRTGPSATLRMHLSKGHPS